ATVVIYDYCLSACASYFFTASKRTHVLGTALVAFHYPISGEPDCPYIGQTPDNEDKRLIVEPCSDLRPVENFALEISGGHGWKRDRDFYDKRANDRPYGSPPQ